MKAAVVRSFADGPQYDVFELAAGEGDIVDVLASALSPRARSGASGAHYASADALPLVAGIDGVGRLASGQRVYFVGDGAMAEQARSRLFVPLPDGVSGSTIAAGMLPAISSWVALTKRAPIQPGQSVLVLGATGTSGQLAIQIAKHLGAGRVIAAGRNIGVLAGSRADQVVALTDLDAVGRAASEVDVVLDYLWGTVTSAVLPALCRHRRDESRALNWVLIGSVTGDEIALSSVLLRKRNLHVLGSGQGATSTVEMFSVAPAVVAAFADHTLDVRAREVPLAEVATWWSTPGDRIVFLPPGAES
jgi:NADPH:quinone reductase-like Zn-dependent oxidoreductase